MDFLEKILARIARRYSLKHCLSGTMKLGERLDREQMKMLRNFFGLTALRENNKQEVRLDFRILLQNGTESQWLEKIGDTLGSPLQPMPANTHRPKRDAVEDILGPLHLAFPELQTLFSLIREDDRSIRSMLSGSSVDTAKKNCCTMAKLVSFLLHNNTPITVSDLGAQFFQNSKALRQGELRTLLVRWLRLITAHAEDIEEPDLLERYHILHYRLTVHAVLYGPIIYEKNGMLFNWIDQLYQEGETAILGWQNIQNIDRIYFQKEEPDVPKLICCENEAPFSNMIQQRTNNCLLFTSGFPSSAVQRLYQLLAHQASSCHHWGDSDPAGLRIAAIMHALHPLQLFRCDLATLKHHKRKLIPLSRQQKNDIMNILENQPDFPFTKELLFTLDNGWLEQENWQPGNCQATGKTTSQSE